MERVGSYAAPQNLLRKSVDDLKALKELKLGIIYLGVETGDEEMLKRIDKGVTRSQMVEAGRKAKEAGITLSVTIVLGLAGHRVYLNIEVVGFDGAVENQTGRGDIIDPKTDAQKPFRLMIGADVVLFQTAGDRVQFDSREGSEAQQPATGIEKPDHVSRVEAAGLLVAVEQIVQAFFSESFSDPLWIED